MIWVSLEMQEFAANFCPFGHRGDSVINRGDFRGVLVVCGFRNKSLKSSDFVSNPMVCLVQNTASLG